MKILFWNVRGIGGEARKKQVKDYIWQEKLDIVGLQETIKQDFSDLELTDLAGGLPFQWRWLPAKGWSGGILMGVKVDILEIETTEVLDFCVTMTIRNRMSNYRFVVTTVYGPAQHEFSGEFLHELDGVCDKESLPMIFGGDFNLIREPGDKSSTNCDMNLMNQFNDFIGKHQLRELARAGSKYTWTNKQGCPVLAKLDRILVTTEWESKFPLCLSWSLTRVGSDHSPIILDSGEQGAPRPKYFFFENQWILQPGFKDMLIDKWQESKQK